MAQSRLDLTGFQNIISGSIDDLGTVLRDINKKDQGLEVTPHAHGLETSFSCSYGNGGKIVAFNAEYDALPGIGHACGHNLIATGSIAAFLGIVAVLKSHPSLQGTALLLGTPAEEGGGGKIKLIAAGAYENVAACLMTHHFSLPGNVTYGTCMASSKFRATFTGKADHAAAAPHEGINALDAAVLAYNGTSMLRQQIKPDQRIQGVLLEGGERATVITPKSLLDYNVRGSTLRETRALQERVVKCFEGAAIATGCKVEFVDTNTYADLRPNRALCIAFSEFMKDVAPEQTWLVGNKPEPGNVSNICPSSHGLYAIPTKDNAVNHTPGFTDAAATDEAHKLTILTSKGMAGVALRVLIHGSFAKEVKDQFELAQKADS